MQRVRVFFSLDSRLPKNRLNTENLLPVCRSTGFTIFELMVVLVIMLSIAAVGVWRLSGVLQAQRLRSAADQLRAEWLDARLKAMEEGQIFCMRLQLGGSVILLDRVLDAHFTASLASRETSDRFDIYNELDPFEKGGFTGESKDFVLADAILSDPSMIEQEGGAVALRLPDGVFAADAIAIPEERAAFYLGLTMPGEAEMEENVSESDEVTNQEIRLGQQSGGDGLEWSTPIFFYPDGTASAAAVLLKNGAGQCIEVRLRALTGIGKATQLTSADEYRGELDPSREHNLR